MTTPQTRLAQADKPSRELDAAIHDSLALPGHRMHPFLVGTFINDGRSGAVYSCPTYTTSVDAALELVPECWRVRDFGDWEDRWCVTLMHEETCETVDARSGRDQPALALAIACLKARGL